MPVFQYVEAPVKGLAERRDAVEPKALIAERDRYRPLDIDPVLGLAAGAGAAR
jgi:hypothetical protein